MIWSYCIFAAVFHNITTTWIALSTDSQDVWLSVDPTFKLWDLLKIVWCLRGLFNNQGQAITPVILSGQKHLDGISAEVDTILFIPLEPHINGNNSLSRYLTSNNFIRRSLWITVQRRHDITSLCSRGCL